MVDIFEVLKESAVAKLSLPKMPSSANEQEMAQGICKSLMKPVGDDGNENGEEEEEDEEDEEEDVDFNPFLKETASLEASSSLSSEIVGDSEHGEEEITAQAAAATPKKACGEENNCQKEVVRKSNRRTCALISQSELETFKEKENGSASSGVDVNDCIGGGNLSNTTHSRKPVMDFDDEDAICRRTRARYSLSSFRLDELEAFLQETDDDDDLQNVDDEEEYRKFLAAVLLGGDGDGQSTQQNENIDDEDEDNDADFEIELEEMLESDCDEGPADKIQKEDFVRARRRPETRQNKCQKASAQYKKKLLEQTKRPLRPLLPILPNGPPISPFPLPDGKTFMPETSQGCPSSAAEYGLTNGFTSYQIGQLYCLIHEHVQLLVQVFSLCILDPTRQHIASQVQSLIFEMLRKRDEALALRIEPYPDICFRPPHTCSSVPDALPQVCLEQRNIESSSSFEVLGVNSSPNSQMPALENISSDKACFWLPSISDPVRSVLYVAPLNLVGEYVDDVYTAVHDYRQHRLTSNSDICCEKAPLFPSFASMTETNGEVPKGRIHPAENTIASATSRQPSKKSLAAALVQSTKKQSVALVPKEISKLAQRFFPLFNPSLFPHKPPPIAVANRVLFTEAEDELLALGMMEYNTDWKAIQQRFLPCKMKHQIFVRQKNRCSSKAPENPIKAVRRMKTSPLTPKEIECIQEGLKFFKLDWMSVWKFVVPHRDPTLLQRQWRIALGTQKSYKQDAAKREKRRLYELKRKCKTADLANWHLDSDKEGENAGGDNNGRDDYIENADEGFVHEAFLADWRPGVSNCGSAGHPCLNLGEEQLCTDALPREVAHIVEKSNNYGSGEAQPPRANMHKFPHASNYSQNPHPSSQFGHVNHGVSNEMQPNHLVPNITSRTSHFQVCSPAYRARRSNDANLVKLAPDLPPVNLPPSVRIISQSAFKTVPGGSSSKISAFGGPVGHAGQVNAVPLNPDFSKTRNQHLIQNGIKIYPMKENVMNSHLEESHVEDRSAEEERGTESDLQMHPLLFQAPEDGRLPYYPLNCTTGPSSSFSFFSGNQPQLNPSLFHSSRQVSRIVNSFNKSLKTKESTSGSGVIDFHPLLKRTDDATNDSVTASSIAGLSAGLEKSDQCKSPFDVVHSKSPVNCGTHATGSVLCSSNEKANELDLEIHLSSSSRKEGALGSGDMAALNPMQSSIIVANSCNKLGTRNPSSIYYQCGENCSQIVSCTSNIDDIGDHSHPGIVMEQEELSDSDEEVEEHVEFECEEMTDSEGEEGSGCEQIAEMPEKEVPSLMNEKAKDGNSDHQQHEALSPLHAQDCVSARKGSSPFLKLGLTNLGKDTKNGSWLSLNSCDPGHPTCTKSKNTEGTISRNLGIKDIPGRPSRSCRKTTPSTKKIAAQTHSTDVVQQLSLSPLAMPGVRKPRKRGCRANTGTNIGTTDDKDGGGEVR